MMDMDGARTIEEIAYVESKGGKREGQFWSVLNSKVFEGNNKIAAIAAASLWHRWIIVAAI